MDDFGIALYEEGIFLILIDGNKRLRKSKCPDTSGEGISNCIKNYQKFRVVQNEDIQINETREIKKINSEYFL